MNDGFIAVLDSGVGGISVLKELIKLMPNERYLYFGDNKNAPYGNKEEKELLDITYNNIRRLENYNIKILVIGCNTLSVTILEQIKRFAKVPTFGVFPPVCKALDENDKVLLLSTCRTAKKFIGDARLKVVGLKNLAKDVEEHLDNLALIDLDKHLYNIKGRFDAVVLGCTHYIFIKNKIFDYFCPLKIYNGEYFTAEEVYRFIKNNKSLENNKGFSLLFMGESASINERFFIKSGQNGEKSGQ